MIRALRGAHRAAFAVLALAVPWAFAHALSKRRPRPAESALPPPFELAGEPGDAIEVREWTWSEARVRTRLERAADALGVRVLSYDARLAGALVLYWEPGGQRPGDAELSGEARFLGALSSSAGPRAPRWSLPESAPGDGSLVLWSLAEGRPLARSALREP